MVDWMNRPLRVTDLTRIRLAGICRSEKRSLDATIPTAVKVGWLGFSCLCVVVEFSLVLLTAVKMCVCVCNHICERSVGYFQLLPTVSAMVVCKYAES